VPRAAALAGAPGAWRTLVRVDSVPDPADAERLCALTADAALPVRWLALTDAVPACAALPAGTLARVAGDARAAVRKELRSARWLIVDGAGKVRYNRRGVPTADEVRRTLALLRGDGAPGAASAARHVAAAPVEARP
jgi:hypothetical protein